MLMNFKENLFKKMKEEIFEISIAVNNIEKTINLIISTEMKDFFAEVKNIFLSELEKNISIISESLLHYDDNLEDEKK